MRSRPIDSSICSAGLVQMNGLGSSFHPLAQARMSASSAWTEVWLPRRTTPPGHRHRAGPRHRNRDASRPPNVNWPRARLDAAGPPRLHLGWLRRHRQPVDSTRSRLRRPSRHGACEGGHKRIVMRNRVWLRCVRSYSARDPQTWRFCGERKERPSGGHNRLSGLTERGSRGWMGRYSRQEGA